MKSRSRNELRYDTTKLAFLGLALLAAELSVLDTFRVAGARVEALVALSCLATLFARDTRQGLLTAWILGLIKDVGSSGPLGLHALLFLSAAWILLLIRQTLFRENILTQFVVAFLIAGGVVVATGLLAEGVSGSMIMGKALATALLTGVALPAIILLFRRVEWMAR